jgi:hypothetical protein
MEKVHIGLTMFACTRSMRAEDVRRGTKISTPEGEAL